MPGRARRRGGERAIAPAYAGAGQGDRSGCAAAGARRAHLFEKGGSGRRGARQLGVMGKLKIAILGLSITSSWGNGHATTYRGLVRELVARGHDVLFLERDVPWYAENRDLPNPPFGRTALYADLAELRDR